MQIGTLTLDNPLILAPLAGISNLPFRLLAKKEGCGLVCSEMISSNGLVRNSKKTLKMLDSTPDEKPLAIQIFGADPAIMADAAMMAQASGADIVDINFGCAVKKVIKTGAGAALMQSPKTAETLLKAVRKAIRIPLTIKIRTGWEKSGAQAAQIAEIAESCGVNAITIHPRTATQGFRGKADWSVISNLKKTVAIPVIGNGDIMMPQDVLKMQTMTGCDAMMIGRAAIGNPWIFSQSLAYLRGASFYPVRLDRRFEVMQHYVEASIKYLGEKQACRMMRSRLGWFVKGLHSGSRFRESIKHLSSEKEALELIAGYRQFLLNLSNGPGLLPELIHPAVKGDNDHGWH